MNALAAIIVFFVLTLLLRRKQAKSLAQPWTYRRLFRPSLYWGIASLHMLSGACVTFAAFGASNVGLDTLHLGFQVFAVTGMLSIVPVHFLTRSLTAPIFEANQIPHADRKDILAFWMLYWLLGLGVGLLPGAGES